MIDLERLADVLSRALEATGPFAPAILLAASLVEYVFPPFPGDLIVVLGAWYAVEGELSWPVTFAAVTAGALAGAWIDYRIGAAIGRRLESRAARRGGLSAERLARFEAAYRRWGAGLLLANRFLPGVRAFIFLGAGATGIPLARVMLLGGISAALWNALLLGLGALVAHNVDELVALVERTNLAAVVGLAVAVAVALVVAAVRRRRARVRAGEGS